MDIPRQIYTFKLTVAGRVIENKILFLQFEFMMISKVSNSINEKNAGY